MGQVEVVHTDPPRWPGAAGTQLLVVDPAGVSDRFADEMSSRGIHVVGVRSLIDGLIEVGRTNPHVVLVAPEAPGIAIADFLAGVKRYSSAVIIAVLESPESANAGSLMLAGVTAAVTRPYTSTSVCDVYDAANRAVGDQARVRFGRIELDARAYAVTVDGARIPDLPLKEFELLRMLMSRAPEVVTDGDLRASLWGHDDHHQPADNTIAVHAGRVRHRLKGLANVRRVRGRGYSLTLD